MQNASTCPERRTQKLDAMSCRSEARVQQGGLDRKVVIEGEHGGDVIDIRGAQDGAHFRPWSR
jgi:hypothetical protein